MVVGVVVVVVGGGGGVGGVGGGGVGGGGRGWCSDGGGGVRGQAHPRNALQRANGWREATGAVYTECLVRNMPCRECVGCPHGTAAESLL